MRNLSLVATGLLALCACTQSVPEPQRADAPAAAAPPVDSLVVLSQTCDGTECASYKVAVTPDGNAIYIGPDYASGPLVDDLRVYRLNAQDHARILKLVRSSDFRALKPNYRLLSVHGKTTTIDVVSGTERQRVNIFLLPCARDVVNSVYARNGNVMRGIKAAAPNIFCETRDLIAEASCARYWGEEARLQVSSDDPTRLEPATPKRCQVGAKP